jgi:DedD protein
MAWFNFGKNDSGMNAKAAVQKPLETVEAMRQRAKFRLIGASLLVLAGVVGFPMLFDSQPRPVAIDIPIEIPDKTKVRPLGAPAAPVAATPAGPTAPASAARVEDSASLSGKEEIVTTAKPGSKLEENKPVSQSNKAQAATKTIVTGAAIAAAGAVAAGVIKNAGDDKAKAAADKASADKASADKAKLAAADKAEADKARKTAEEEKAKKLKADKALAADKAKADAEAKRAKDLLDGTAAKPAAPAVAATAATKAAATESGRFIVQFGAFSDVAKSREVRQKVERAGLKTYSQIAKTAEGERIRVRVGPFATRAEADKAAAKIKSLDLPASVLTL